MAFFHGVKGSEVPTSIVPAVATTAGLPVVFGTAPVHLTDEPNKYVNKPVICYDWKEAVGALGYSGEWDKYTLSEVTFSEFQLYNVKPIIFVNVLDPKKHKAHVADTEGHAPNEDGEVIIEDSVLLPSLKILFEETQEVIDGDSPVDDDIDDDLTEPATSVGSTTTVTVQTLAAPGDDYTAAYNDDGELVIAVIEGGKLDGAEKIFAEYDRVDASLVTANDIIGGVGADGSIKGMEWINQIYTLFSLVPGIIAAPGWSQNPTVAAIMKAKALNISGLFRCIALTDVDTEQVKQYSDVNLWKNTNNYTGNNQVVCWPCVRNGDYIFNFSTHLLGVIGYMDAQNDDVPYQSPSNIMLQATGLCLKDGTEINISHDQADLLNSQGIMTGLNFSGGWKTWGNYLASYPSITDVKDSWICVRRMFDWRYQAFILTYWQKVDQPLMPRLIKTIVDSEQVILNGLVSRGYMLGADVKFLEDENPTTDLLAGIIRFHIYITPPVAAQEIDAIFEYDVNNFRALFGDAA